MRWLYLFFFWVAGGFRPLPWPDFFGRRPCSGGWCKLVVPPARRRGLKRRPRHPRLSCWRRTSAALYQVVVVVVVGFCIGFTAGVVAREEFIIMDHSECYVFMKAASRGVNNHVTV
jgi:hypothetical protein